MTVLQRYIICFHFLPALHSNTDTIDLKRRMAPVAALTYVGSSILDLYLQASIPIGLIGRMITVVIIPSRNIVVRCAA